MISIRARRIRQGASLLTLASASLAYAVSAQAQTVTAPASAPDAPVATPAEDGSVGEVVVTGFRSSLARALNLKRESAGAIDSIVAEDIAKFPDNNLAESVQRIPGVSISRDSGEGRQISVRGLGADFTRVRLNGMEALATTGGISSTGGTNASRGFDFNIFASELFSGIQVRKTASASTDEGSLGATVDLRTGRPFDYHGMKLAGSAQLGYSEQRKKADPRVALLFSDTFADDKIGILLSGVYSKRSTRMEGTNSGQWDNGNNNGGFGASLDPDIPLSLLNTPTIHNARFPRYLVYMIDEERLGLTGSVQFKPTDRTTISFDGAFARLHTVRDEYYLESIGFAFPASRGGKPGYTLLDGEIRDNLLIYGKFDGADIRAEDLNSDYTTKFSQFNVEWEQEFSDRFKATAYAGISKSALDIVNFTVQLDRYNQPGYSYDYRDSLKYPAINYNFDVTNPANWYVGPNVNPTGVYPGSPLSGVGNQGPEIRYRPQQVTNKFRTGQLDLAYEATDWLTLRAGAQAKRFSFDIDSQRLATELNIPAIPNGKTVADLTSTLDAIKYTYLAPGNPGTWLVPDAHKFIDVYGIKSNTGYFQLLGADNVAARGDIRSVVEQDRAAYAQADFKGDLGGVKIHGDLGVRYVHTKQASTGYANVGSGYNQLTVGQSYHGILPALNVAADLGSDLVLRFGAAKVISRPPLGSLTPGGSVSVGGGRSVQSGNPNLDPIRAKTLDFAAEWYFAPQSLISAAVFYKKIDTYIQTLTEIRPFNTSGLPDSILAGTGISPTDNFTFQAPVNTPGGPLKGFEINYQQPLKFLPGPLANLGLLLNFTYVDSKISYILNSTTGASTKLDLVGLSRKAYNATIYYEDRKLSARASAAYRSSYLRGVPGPFGYATSSTEPTLYVDASLSYKISKVFTVSLEAINLTDEYDANDIGQGLSEDYRHVGRQYSLGLRFTF
ncbi:TonB-dependent receptor [Sphingomonas crusticola]|uniref:TonB-dependent receptor n=1 Tax=Sphingomonas crusticola TaxID=1697973 RepID=UPI000E243D9D|nr:TonB-dependent receptor [Sphingomonas crusticola]